MTRSRAPLALGGLVVAAWLVLAAGVAPASAAPSEGYATWTVAGTMNNYTGALSLPAGFPATTVASTSRTFATSSGNAAWLPPASPPGQLVGSSQGRAYVSLNPASPTTPSVTTFTFAKPSPVGVWGAAFGDVDAESITISATDSTGAPVAAADLGITSFNYCDDAPNSCSSPTLPLVLPTLTNSPTSVTAEDPTCPAVPASCNTQGGSVWVAPLVPLSTLSITSTNKSGSPALQMWFASIARTVAGVVTLDGVPPVTVELLDAAGDVVTSAPTAADGSYVLPPVVPSSDYTLRVDPMTLPPGAVADSVAVDASAGDVIAPAITVTAVPVQEAALAPTGADPSATPAVALVLLALGAAAVSVSAAMRRYIH